jgi:hypothetical protein
MSEMGEIEFIAILPEIKSASNIHRDGASIKLEIPASEKAAYHKLLAYGFDRRLRVTVREDEGD